jgi:DNA-directed RNA polymerase specialized sigma24 family protein
MNSFDETTYFRYCRKIDGSLEPVDVAKRNDRLVPRFHPSVLEPDFQTEPDESPEYRELVEEVSQNLSPVERRTWLRLLDGMSILDIAAEDGVSRAAIYERIRGSSKGHGGMIAKNGYVAIWWRLRNKTNQHL